MLSYELLLWAMAIGGAYLLVVSFMIELIERKLQLNRSLPSELIETDGWVWWGINFIMELLFYVGIPLVGYAFFYFALPFSGMMSEEAVVTVCQRIGYSLVAAEKMD